MNISEAVTRIAARLDHAGIENPRREARIILAASLGTDAAGLLSREEIDPVAAETLVARREAREPLAYILGRREFWGLDFLTSPATLIPRPESETLIEAALDVFPARAAVRQILDLGTGTGCLLLAAMGEFTGAFGVGIDIAAAAAALAARNAARLGFANVAFLAGDWAAALDGKFDLVLSNPPYIATPALTGLMPEVRDFEPLAALDGGAEGLNAYQAVIAALPRLLAPAAAAVLELGAGQAQAVSGLARAAGFSTATRADLAGIPRALVIRR